jgi:hypothetical protein
MAWILANYYLFLALAGTQVESGKNVYWDVQKVESITHFCGRIYIITIESSKERKASEKLIKLYTKNGGSLGLVERKTTQ